MSQHDVELLGPGLVRNLRQRLDFSHSDDVDDAVHAAEFALRRCEDAFHVRAGRHVRSARYAAHRFGDGARQEFIPVYAQHPRASLRQGMGRLFADALPCPEHHEAASIQAQQGEEVRLQRHGQAPTLFS